MLSQYELERERRIAANREKIKALGIHQAKEQVQKVAVASAPRKKRAAPRAVRPLVPLDDKRQSSRLKGVAPKNYNESVLDQLELKERGAGRKSKLPALFVALAEEKYTQEHVALLGDYEEPWELFVDGYDGSGNRIYDKVNGMTCHQCRQKTLGRHTTCSECNSLHGVFCGDCLFMRYGENILEVEAKGPWKCPPCRDLCNCSIHRVRRGWGPTGSMYRRAIAEGYRSVAHYLVLTNLATNTEAAPDKQATEDATSAAQNSTDPASVPDAEASRPSRAKQTPAASAPEAEASRPSRAKQTPAAASPQDNAPPPVPPQDIQNARRGRRAKEIADPASLPTQGGTSGDVPACNAPSAAEARAGSRGKKSAGEPAIVAQDAAPAAQPAEKNAKTGSDAALLAGMEKPSTPGTAVRRFQQNEGDIPSSVLAAAKQAANGGTSTPKRPTRAAKITQVFRQTTTPGIALAGKKAARPAASPRDPLQPVGGRVTKVNSLRTRTRRAAAVAN